MILASGAFDGRETSSQTSKHISPRIGTSNTSQMIVKIQYIKAIFTAESDHLMHFMILYLLVFTHERL